MIKKIFFSQIIILLCCLNNSQQEFIYQQSDRVFIKEITESVGQGSAIIQQERFPAGLFKQIPSVLYSVQGLSTENDALSFRIDTMSVSETMLTYRVAHLQYYGKVRYLTFQILAIDDPSVQIVDQVINCDRSASLITMRFQGHQKIKSFTSFMYGYKSYSLDPSLKLEYERIDDFNFNLILKIKDLDIINLNYLIVYEGIDTTEFQSLYSYQEYIDHRNVVPLKDIGVDWTEKTNLIDGSLVLFGVKDLKISGCIQFKIQKQVSSLVKGNNVVLQYFNGGCELELNGLQMQFLVKTCEVDECLYQNLATIKNECRKIENNFSTVMKTLYIKQILICILCRDNCLKCMGEQIEKCLACYVGKYLNPFNQKCEDQQPSETYCVQETVDGNTFYNCRQCHESCQSCQDGNYNGCTKCKKTNALPIQYLLNGQCFPYQPHNTYCGLKNKRMLIKQ